MEEFSAFDSTLFGLRLKDKLDRVKEVVHRYTNVIGFFSGRRNDFSSRRRGFSWLLISGSQSHNVTVWLHETRLVALDDRPCARTNCALLSCETSQTWSPSSTMKPVGLANMTFVPGACACSAALSQQAQKKTTPSTFSHKLWVLPSQRRLLQCSMSWMTWPSFCKLKISHWLLVAMHLMS